MNEIQNNLNQGTEQSDIREIGIEDVGETQELCGKCQKSKGKEEENCKCGRPLKFKSVEELENKIAEYLEKTPKEEWTITGLAIALDTFRNVLCDYEDRDEFSITIKRAKLMVEHSYELDLKKHGRTGTIFALKNFKWKDENKTDITSKGESIAPINGMTIVYTKSNKENDKTM